MNIEVTTDQPEFNECADLIQDDITKEAKDLFLELKEQNKSPLEYMKMMQRDLQVKLHERLPEQTLDVEKLTDISVKIRWYMDNKAAFDDEFREIIDALPGMSMPAKDRSAVWKKWKKKYPEIRKMKLTDLSEKDIKELQMEYIDALHFMLNMLIADNLPIPSINIKFQPRETIGEIYDEIESTKLIIDIYFYTMMQNIIKSSLSYRAEVIAGVFDKFISLMPHFGLSEESLFVIYYIKNAENHRRSKSGY